MKPEIRKGLKEKNREYLINQINRTDLSEEAKKGFRFYLRCLNLHNMPIYKLLFPNTKK